MLFILDGTIGADISIFLSRLQEETLSYSIILYEEWIKQANFKHDTLACNDHYHEHPSGIIFLRVQPEIALKRLQKYNLSEPITLDYIQQIYHAKEQFFIENTNNPEELKNLSVLVLNGNIDFQTDFAQFYNHLFYIRRFIKQIEERKEIALGIHKEKAPHRKCC
jgi:hypothetical protein